jgi:superkiller protein 3
MNDAKRYVILGIALVLAACGPSQKKLAEQRERDPQFQYDKAVVCMQYGLADEAFKYLNEAIRLDPNHYLSFNLLGLAYMVKANPAEAAKAFENCLAIKPDFSEALNNLGTAYQESGQIDKAEAAFKRAFELDQNYNASFNLARIYYDKGLFDRALALVQNSIDKYDRSILAWNLKGLILESQEKLPEAIASYEQALKIVPGEVNISFNMGVAYYKARKYDKAKEIMEKILPLAKTEELKTKIQDVLKRLKG